MDNNQTDNMPTLLFTNLQLLGMDVVAMEGKYHTPFNKDMFNLPNKAGSEAVLHFLFDRLDPELFKKQFRDCWPIVDRKSELQFRKVCNSWLTTIQTDNPDAHLPRINPSLLLSPGGHKYIHLLYRFSTHVLVQIMLKEHGYDPQDSQVYPVLNQTTSAYGDIMKYALEDSCQQLQASFFDQLHLSVAGNRKWKDSADELIKAYRHLSRTSRDLENEKRQLVRTLAENAQKQNLSLPAKRTLSMFDSDQDIYSTKRGQRMEKARSQWKELLNFCEDMGDKREILRSILNPDSDKPAVNGTDLGIRIPNLLLQDFRKEIQAQEIDNVYIGGHLNLESVAQLWNLSLKCYKEQMEKEPLPDLGKEIPAINTQVHHHHGHLQAAHKNRDEIKNITLPKIQKEMEKLHKKLSKLPSVTYDQDQSKNNTTLSLTAPTPPLTFLARGSQTGDTPTGPVPMSSQLKTETPDGISSMQEEIEHSVLQSSSQTEVIKDKYLTARLQALKKRSDVGKSAHQSATAKATPSVKKSQIRQKDQTRTMLTKPPVHKNSSQQKKSNCSEQPTKTPTTRKQSAEDLLANLVVDSVLDADNSGHDLWGSDFKCLNDSLFATSPRALDQAAFISKDLLARSPQDNLCTPNDVLTETSPSTETGKLRQDFNNPNTPQWEKTSPQGTTKVKSFEKSSEFFSPAVWQSLGDATGQVSPTNSNVERSQVTNQGWSPPISPNTLARDAEKMLKSLEGEFASSEDSVLRTKAKLHNSPETLFDPGEENHNEKGLINKSWTRFPGDGQTSHESLASSATSSDSNADIGLETGKSLSRDSLVSEASEAKEASSLIDVFITNVGDALNWRDGLAASTNLESVLPVSSSTAVTSVSSSRDPALENASVGENYAGIFRLSSVEKADDPSTDNLLQLDSGDDLLHCSGESFSPVKEGIVLASGKPLHKGSSKSNYDATYQHSRSTNYSESSPAGRMNHPVSKSCPDTTTQSYKSPMQERAVRESHVSRSTHKSQGDDVLTQMALLQQRVANILNDSSDDD